MPTSNTYSMVQTKLEPIQAPELARTISAKFGASADIAKGTLLGELTASPGVYAAYDHTAVDGVQVLKGIAMYDIVTDANGIITNLGGPLVSQNLSAPIYYSGYFACGDVENASELDDAIAAGYARLVQGNATTGIFAIGL